MADTAGEDHSGPGGYGDHKEPHEETWRARVSEKASLQVALSGRSGMLAAHADLLEEEAGLMLEHLPHTGGGSCESARRFPGYHQPQAPEQCPSPNTLALLSLRSSSPSVGPSFLPGA